MQLLFDSSEENGGTECLGVIGGTVKQFRPSDVMCKIPQMGWNTVRIANEHPVFKDIEDESEFYFVHSFYPSPAGADVIVGQTEYADVVFASAAAKGNVAATQFHPERSGRIGLQLLENFCRWDTLKGSKCPRVKC